MVSNENRTRKIIIIAENKIFFETKLESLRKTIVWSSNRLMIGWGVPTTTTNWKKIRR